MMLCVMPTRKWHLILDSFFAHGQSANDGISKDSCSLQFTTVDDAACLIAQLVLPGKN